MKKSNTKKYPGVYYNENTNTYYVDSKAKSLDGIYVKIKKSGFTTASKAYEYKAKEKDRIESNYQFIVKTNKSQFEALFEAYFEHLKGKNQLQTINPKKGLYKNHIKAFFENKDINKISIADVQMLKSYLTDQKYQAQYKNKIVGLFLDFIDYAVLFNYLKIERANQFKQLLQFYDDKQKHRGSGCKGILTPNAFNDLMCTYDEENKIELKYKLATMLIYQTGCRNGECRSLYVEDFNPINRTIRFHTHVSSKLGTGKWERLEGLKASNEKIESIPSTLATKLYEWILNNDLKPNDFIFFGIDGHNSPISENAFRKQYKSHLELAGLNTELRVHDLRHSHSTVLIDAGVDMNTVKERMGHASIQTTIDIYTHITENQNQKLNNKLDELFN